MAKRRYASEPRSSKMDRDAGNATYPRSPNIPTRGEEYTYAGRLDKEHIEAQDGGMIREDHSAIANLPQNVMIKAYPKPDTYGHYDLDDTIESVDNQRVQDAKYKKGGKFPEMY